MDAFMAAYGLGDLSPGSSGRMNVVRVGPSVMTTGSRVTLHVVAGGIFGPLGGAETVGREESLHGTGMELAFGI
jgi:hypothetical protein